MTEYQRVSGTVLTSSVERAETAAYHALKAWTTEAPSRRVWRLRMNATWLESASLFEVNFEWEYVG